MPDPSELIPVANTYKTSFVQASGKSTRDCQAALSQPFNGALKVFAQWCQTAREFKPALKCSEAPAGTPQSPTLTCIETVTVTTKDGNHLQGSPTRRTFHFARNGDAWVVSRID
jgi:hypothetical protein